MRAVLDPNILIAALLSPKGAPSDLLRAWLDGAFELVVSATLLDELERALAYPKLRERIPPEDADEYLSLLERTATVAADPARGTHRSVDPGDDYLLALAENERAVLSSGGKHLLALAGTLPIQTAREFVDVLAGSS